jgi:hypothetical protein
MSSDRTYPSGGVWVQSGPDSGVSWVNQVRVADFGLASMGCAKGDDGEGCGSL